MTLYLNTPAVGNWPEPLESTWQLLGGDKASDLAPKLPHLGLSDILFLSTVLSIAVQNDRGASSPGYQSCSPGYTRWATGCWPACKLKPRQC